MKKIMSLVVVLCLLFTMAVPTFASKAEEGEKQMEISKDEAISLGKEALKEYFGLSIDKNYQSRVDIREDYEQPDSYIWQLSWSYSANQKSMHANVSIHGDTGTILEIDQREYDHSQEGQMIAQITKEEAQKIAEKFVARVNPEAYKQVTLQQHNRYPGSFQRREYDFSFVRQIDGVDFDRDTIYVQVNGITGEVSSYRYRWHEDLVFPSIENIITIEGAQAQFEEGLQMKLNYMPIRNRDFINRVEGVRLVYNPFYENGSIIDAGTGTFFKWPESSQEKVINNITEEEKKAIAKEAKAYDETMEEMDQEEAKKAILDIIETFYGDDYDINYMRYIDEADDWETAGQKAWSAQFEKAGNMYGPGDTGRVTIHAVTGQILRASLYQWNENDMEDFKSKLSWEEAYDKAIEAIATYYPEKIVDIDTEQIYIEHKRRINGKEVEDPYYYFNFKRVANDLPYYDNNINLRFDQRTGKLSEIGLRWNEGLEFPSPDQALSEEKVKMSYLDHHKPQLVYTLLPKEDGEDRMDQEVKLVYRLQVQSRDYGYVRVDALTGKFIDMNGEEVAIKEDTFDELIKGHWGEKALKILADQGIIAKDDFQLNEDITRLEAIKLLVKAKGYHSYMTRDAEPLKFTNYNQEDADYNYLQMAVRYGMIKNEPIAFKGDEKVTREEMAKMMVDLLGYNQLAQSKDVFKLPFEDADLVTPDKVGYMAICKGLNIIEGSNGKVRPKDYATMVEMAITIYKALGSLK